MMSATLASLGIRNLALVEDLVWEPPSGFVAVTGETGAGKSIILGALKLLLGERADKSLVRSGADSCRVEAVFEIPPSSEIHALLEVAGAEPCEDGVLVAQRRIAAGGGSRQFVNGSACTLGLLRDIGDLLVDLHGPHDHQSLFSTDNQLLVLDSFAGADQHRMDYASRRKEWARLVTEKKQLAGDAMSLEREKELLRHQSTEIEEAALQPGEEEDLANRLRTASNAKRLREACSLANSLLAESESSAMTVWTSIGRLVREIKQLDPAAADIMESSDQIFESMGELSRTIDRYAESLEESPRDLPSIEERLDTIQSLKRKYGPTIEDVVEFGRRSAERLAELENSAERLASLETLIAEARHAMDEAADRLHDARAKALDPLCRSVRGHLSDLGFLRSDFRIGLERTIDPGPLGADAVEFLFAPNPGEPPKPLRAIASSGEISRVMLALKTALAAQAGVPVLVFDEIDANVGGETGSMVGEKMRELGATRQVFSITHLPQVAACASSHFVVRKNTDGKRTTTSLHRIDQDARVDEIARMLGGSGASARSHAKALLDSK
jgi:DNA repair protein RecN (Recombination protein N)